MPTTRFYVAHLLLGSALALLALSATCHAGVFAPARGADQPDRLRRHRASRSCR